MGMMCRVNGDAYGVKQASAGPKIEDRGGIFRNGAAQRVKMASPYRAPLRIASRMRLPA
jgi:hypothetical protein